jgi:hypothetical protein
MKLSKKAVFILLLAIAVSAFMLLKGTADSENKQLSISNAMPDITITEVCVEPDTVNRLEQPLEPGEICQFPIPDSNLILKAVDTAGGVYSSAVPQADTAKLLFVELSMSNRSVFGTTIESGGEYWAGSGLCTVRVTNDLAERDIFRVTVTENRATSSDSSDALGAFILFPGKTVNVRVEPGDYTVTAEDDLRSGYTCNTLSTDRTHPVATCEITESLKDHTMQESGSGSSSLVLCNALGDWIIIGLYWKHSENDKWGENCLTSGLEPKKQYLLALDPGTYDVKAVDEDHDTYTVYSIVVLEEGTNRGIRMDDLDQYIP